MSNEHSTPEDIAEATSSQRLNGTEVPHSSKVVHDVASGSNPQDGSSLPEQPPSFPSQLQAKGLPTAPGAVASRGGRSNRSGFHPNWRYNGRPPAQAQNNQSSGTRYMATGAFVDLSNKNENSTPSSGFADDFSSHFRKMTDDNGTHNPIQRGSVVIPTSIYSTRQPSRRQEAMTYAGRSNLQPSTGVSHETSGVRNDAESHSTPSCDLDNIGSCLGKSLKAILSGGCTD